MYGAPAAFATSRGFLLDQSPQVLMPKSLQPLELHGLGSIGPPVDINNDPHHSRHPEPARAFNPSITQAPLGLCPRCVYAVTLRVDTLHQCSSASSPYNQDDHLLASSWFHGTAIGILDARLRMLGWTWLLNSPEYQIASSDVNVSEARRAGCAVAGEADAFPPVWAKQTYDARLLHLDGELLVTYACPSCVFSISPVRITAEPTPDGLHSLRAWATDRITYQYWPWLAGRNQALFAYDPLVQSTAREEANKDSEEANNARRGTSLWVQSRFGVVGCLGWPRYEQLQSMRCNVLPKRRSGQLPRPENCHGDRKSLPCGSSPLHTQLKPRALRGINGRGARLRTNATAALRRALRVAGAFGGLSLTSHLVRVSRRVDGRACDIYLGVGHLHRGEGELNRRLYRRRVSAAPWERSGEAGARADVRRSLRRRQPFAFGFRYTHFFYALEPQPPFGTIAVSAEFCLGTPQDARDCESVQFISGMTLRREVAPSNSSRAQVDSSTLLLAYGVNDCEARLGSLPMSRVWAMLQPLSDAPTRRTSSAARCWPGRQSIA